jgi:hypothetical protein
MVVRRRAAKGYAGRPLIGTMQENHAPSFRTQPYSALARTTIARN